VRVYEANLTSVELLGRSYGFEPLFYWQPVLIYQRVRQSEALNGERYQRSV